MALCLVWIGRFVFLGLVSLQSYSLASYPAEYKHDDGFYGLCILFAPALVLRVYIMCEEKRLQWLFAVWIFYVIAFVILIGIIFGGSDPIEENLDKEKFFGPNILKMTLCLSPFILLLLLSTGTDSIAYRELIWMLSLRIALDLFDGVEMLDVIIEESEVNNDISDDFEKAILAFVCISFLLSPLQLIEVKLDRFDDWKYRKCTMISRTTIQVLAVNCVFLGLRLALYLRYGKDASIFIAKNVIIIFLGLFEICSVCKCCGCEYDDKREKKRSHNREGGFDTGS